MLQECAGAIQYNTSLSFFALEGTFVSIEKAFQVLRKKTKNGIAYVDE